MSILVQTLRHAFSGLRLGTKSDRHETSTNPLIEYLEGHPGGRLVPRFRHYFDVYHRHFSRFRGKPVTMIEIGIFNGGSLPMWRDYFGSQARIVGVDINP